MVENMKNNKRRLYFSAISALMNINPKDNWNEILRECEGDIDEAMDELIFILDSYSNGCYGVQYNERECYKRILGTLV